jgi:hypothetical protein
MEKELLEDHIQNQNHKNLQPINLTEKLGN